MIVKGFSRVFLVITYLTILKGKNCVSLNSVPEFIEIGAWLPLTFFACLHNQSSCIHFIVT